MMTHFCSVFSLFRKRYCFIYLFFFFSTSNFLLFGNNNANLDLKQYNYLIKQYDSIYKTKPLEALSILWKAKSISYKINKSANINYLLGYLNYKLVRYDSAVYYLKSSEKYNLKLKQIDSTLLGKTYQRLGYVYDKLDNFDLQLSYLKKGIKFFSLLKNKKKLIYLYNSLGTLYSSKPELIDSSLYYYRKGFLLPIDHKLKGTICLNIGAVYLGNISNDSAVQYFNKAQKYKLSNNSLSTLYYNKSVIFEELNKLDSTIFYLHRALDLNQKEENLTRKTYIYENLSNAYYKINDKDKAIAYLKKFARIKDSILELDIVKSVAEIETKYQTEKKEKENLQLKANNFNIESKRKQNLNLLIISVLFIVAGSFIYILSLKNSKRKRKLAIQEKEIEQQKNLTLLKEQEISSINAMIDGQEKERARIAEDLHDNIGSVLSTLKLHFENLKLNRDKKHFNQEELYKKTENLIDETYTKVRKIAHAKNSGLIANQGLLVAVKNLAAKISAADKIQIEVIDFGLDKRIENSIEITIFRIIQELVTNIVKHANATKASINISLFDNGLNLIVEDNGKGFKKKSMKSKNSMGLTSIKKRVNHLNGNFEIDSFINKGTTIIIEIPV